MGPQELTALVEGYLDELALTPELGELAGPIRYALAGGGKRIRPVLCLAAGEALGREPHELLPAGAAIELVQATLGMIGGQHADTKELGYDLEEIHRLKTGRLFYASIACALWVAELPEADQKPWRDFADELGMLFQVVDDILDGDGYVLSHGDEGARRLADEAAERAQARLAAIDADTSVLAEIVAGLATRTA